MSTRTKFISKPLRQFTVQEKIRFDEVLFCLLIDLVKKSKKAAAAPYGSSLPKVLASLMKGVNPTVIEYAYNVLSTESDKPSTEEMVAALKVFKVSAAASPYNPGTYYKWLGKWTAKGQPVREPLLAELQIIEIKKFIKAYINIFSNPTIKALKG